MHEPITGIPDTNYTKQEECNEALLTVVLSYGTTRVLYSLIQYEPHGDTRQFMIDAYNSIRWHTSHRSVGQQTTDANAVA